MVLLFCQRNPHRAFGAQSLPCNQAFSKPIIDHMDAHRKLPCQLSHRQSGGRLRCRCWDIVLVPDPRNHAGGKSLAFGTALALLVQDSGNLLIRLLPRQLAHLFNKRVGVTPAVRRIERQLDHEVFGGTPLPA